MLGVNFDVTEARLAQEAVLEGQAKLEAALASMTDAVFIGLIPESNSLQQRFL